jgi:murein L,D-transpeptidase YafK
MKSKIGIIFILLSVSFSLIGGNFKADQLKQSRVKTAYKEKEKRIKDLLEKKRINVHTMDIFIRAFKKEEVLEVWATNKSENFFKFIIQYKFCASSGGFGPKRRQGDFQIPEGFYFIDRFNPWSRYYLSLGINYPNRSDRILGYKRNLGGDIFIHGNCCTIGCIPITDDKIKELYIFAVEAKSNGQRMIPVHIFPARLDKKGFEYLKDNFSDKASLIEFWKNLREGYNFFENNKSLPKVSVLANGNYKFE